jgi:hypothetical protein
LISGPVFNFERRQPAEESRMSSPKDRRKTVRLLRDIDTKQKIAVLAPIVLVGVMVPIFRLLSGLFETAIIGWYLGLVSYWFTWRTILALIIGAGLFGFFLSFLAKKTGTIWRGILAHILGGIVMII